MEELEFFNELLDEEIIVSYYDFFGKDNIDYRILLIYDFLNKLTKNLKKENNKDLFIFKINFLMYRYNHLVSNIKNYEIDSSLKDVKDILKKIKKVLSLISNILNKDDYHNFSKLYLYITSIAEIKNDINDYLNMNLKADKFALNNFDVDLNSKINIDDTKENLDKIHSYVKSLKNQKTIEKK